MVYTITFNPALDYTVEIEDFKQGEINRSKSELILPGGKGINVSQVLNNLGIANKAIAFIADFTGDKLEQLLKEKRIDTDFIRTKEGMTRINVKIVSKRETAINCDGPKIDENDLKILYEKLDLIQKDDFLVLSGSIPKELSFTIYEEIFERLNDKKINIIVDARKQLLTNILKYRPFLIKPNKEELEEIFNIEIKSRDDVIKYAKELKNMGAVNVLISLGSDGAILIDEKDNIYYQKVPPCQIIKTVGSGDSTVAGFLMRIHQYKRL